jgi:hypothetical protein
MTTGGLSTIIIYHNLAIYPCKLTEYWVTEIILLMKRWIFIFVLLIDPNQHPHKPTPKLAPALRPETNLTSTHPP